jgi:mannosyltransferase
MLPLLTESLWRDEAFSVILSGKSIVQIISLSTQDPSPPFYYILLHFWMTFFGNGEIAIRILSLLSHIGAGIFIYLIAKKIFKNFLWQLITTLTILINPFLIQYAFEARAYSLLVFLSVASFYFILVKKNLIAGILSALAMFSHNFGVPTFFILTFWWIVFNRKDFSWKSFLKLICFPLLIMLLWGGVILHQWAKVGGGFWIPKPTINSFMHSFKLFTTGELYYPIKSTLYLLSEALFLVSLASFILNIRKKINTFIWLVILQIILPILATFIFSQFFTPIYYERYLILTTPMLMFFIFYSLKPLLKISYIKMLSGILIGAYLVIIAISSFQIITKTTKADIRTGVSQILSKAEPGDIIVPKNVLNFLETEYYVQRSGKNLPVYAQSSSGKVPFYIGGILYDPGLIIKSLPTGKRIWQIDPNGQYRLIVL